MGSCYNYGHVVQLVEHPSKRPHEFGATLLQSNYIFNLPEANQWRVNSLVLVVVAVHFWILKKDELANFQCITNSVIWVFYNKKNHCLLNQLITV